MGDVRYERAYERVAQAEDRAATIAQLDDEDVVAALGAAARGQDALLANVLATEAMNRMRRAGAIARHQGESALAADLAGRCTFANRAAVASLGLARGALVGKPLAEIFRVEGPDAAPDPAERALAAAETLSSSDLVLHSAAGRSFPVAITYAPILAEDEPRGVVVTFRDVTSLRDQEERLRQANRFLQATIDALPVTMAILDEDGRIVAVNARWRAFAESNGLAWPDAGLGRNYISTCDSAEGEEVAEADEFARAIREILTARRDEFELEYPCHSPEEKRWFLGRVARLAWTGPTRAVVTHLDITRRKLAELRAAAARAAPA